MTVHDPRASGRLARANFSAAHMSDTKWRKLFSAVGEAYPEIEKMIVKFIDVDNPHTMRFPPGLRCPRPYMDTIEFGPTELQAIEWLELPIDLASLLTAIGKFPITISGNQTRIAGYTSPI